MFRATCGFRVFMSKKARSGNIKKQKHRRDIDSAAKRGNMTNIITLRIVYEGCEERIWREVQISDKAFLSTLGYTVLATFDTLAEHLFQIEHNGEIYELPSEEEELKPERCVFCVKLCSLDLQVGSKLSMVYDFGCEQVFTMEVTGIAEMPRGKGRAFPKVIAGKGRGIIDDLPADELLEVIHDIDKNGASVFYYEAQDDANPWDYRNYEVLLDNFALKTRIMWIEEAYSACGAYLEI